MNNPRRTARRWLYALALCNALAPGHTLAQESIPLTCGSALSGTIPAGGSARFRFRPVPDQRIAIDAVDLDARELLRIRIYGPDGLISNTCTGRIQPPLRAATQLTPEAGYAVVVSACRGNEEIEYGLSFNTVSAIPQNCSARLPCAETIEAEFDHAGEVDPYRFEGTVGETVRIEASEDDSDIDGVELRIFDPDGALVDSGLGGIDCARSRDLVLPKTGTYTVLANPCYGIGKGEYEIGWFPSACPASGMRGITSAGSNFGIRTTHDGSAVVEISSNGLSCGFTDTPSFVWQPNPALPIVNGRFRGDSLPLAMRGVALDIDGVVMDANDDGALDQGVGGLSIALAGGRCNFSWVANSLTDTDGDGWNDSSEERFDSDHRDALSTPEGAEVPTTILARPATCDDWIDNDGDGDTDEDDEACEEPTPGSLGRPTVFAGKNSSGSPVWLRINEDGTFVEEISAAYLSCGSFHSNGRSLEVHLPIQDGAFAASGIRFAEGSATWSIDGKVFDGDGDGVPDQILGGFQVRDGNTECRWSSWASALVDSDSDGWGDSAERSLGSDPIPIPAGLGAESTPESALIPATALFGAPVCFDGRDNDGDDKADAADAPSCGVAATPTVTLPTRTPTPVRPCLGDKTGDREVTVDELLEGILCALSPLEVLAWCDWMDANEDGAITVDEIVVAVNNAIQGC